MALRLRPMTVLLCAFAGHCCLAQPNGASPSATLGAIDIYSAFRLPPLKEKLLSGRTSGLSVIRRAAALGLSAGTATEAWQAGQGLLNEAEGISLVTPPHVVSFTGDKASALNRVLQKSLAVRVASPALSVDEPIRIAHSGTFLDLGAARLTANDALPYMLRVDTAAGVTLMGGEFAAGDSAILVNGSEHVLVQSVHIRGLKGNGVVVTHSSHVVIRGGEFTGLGRAPVLLHGGTSSTVVERNEIVRNAGSSNMSAAVVISDREVDVSVRGEALFGPDNYWVLEQPMQQRLHPPRGNLIVRNHLAWNASSAIYLDGAVGNIAALNLIEGNAKEGICLDNGATANVVTLNDVLQNGSRWGESDAVMEKDAIKAGGRLPNGTPAAKVPGISIDNAAFNVVFANQVTHNFGGGIKIVRTGYFNAIGLNTIFANNDGASDRFHFFGIELGAAGLDTPSPELEGAPSSGNIVFSNTIRGNHYSGIFFASGSDNNDVFDNVIIDAEKWALEAVVPMTNSSLNNLTVMPSRNIESGLTTPH